MREAVAYLDARMAQGAGMETVGREIGLAGNTLRHWRDRFGGPVHRSTPVTPSASASGFLPVGVVSATPAVSPQCLVVCTPQGLRVEGLDVAQAAELLRKLS
jgi:hypothetical protein